ncbi:uncharacterized protein LOC108627342 [Ceratina calcarata]|uniref:Uncharacterized protein LOC108627342 n=1 Tax=Ceratina calcarata TaxID=156304 RepID=A0AAJ7N9B3_9HYME|nr:uncharacterized protein LOC108627342 [Ceratina calcarata]
MMFINYMATSCLLDLRSRFNSSSLFIAFCILPLIDSGYAQELTPAAGVERWNSHVDQHEYKVLIPNSDMNYDNKDTAPVQDIQIDSTKPCKTNVELKVLETIFERLFGSNHMDIEDNELYEIVIISIFCCGLEIVFTLFLFPIFLIVFITGRCFRINIVIGPICQSCHTSNELREKKFSRSIV